MLSLKKILAISVLVLYLALTSVCLYAKNKTKNAKQKTTQGITLGFKTGKNFLYTTSAPSRLNKKHPLSTRSFFISKPINNCFRIETGINYNTVQNTSIGLGGTFSAKPYTVSIPVTVQYYFLPEKHRIQPFCGAGFQYQLNAGNNIAPATGDWKSTLSTTVPPPGTKYINILFTQGVTFEINTKIQISESIHFSPGNSDRMLGIDLGLGYKLP